MRVRYAVVIEKVQNNYAAYVPDLRRLRRHRQDHRGSGALNPRNDRTGPPCHEGDRRTSSSATSLAWEDAEKALAD